MKNIDPYMEEDWTNESFFHFKNKNTENIKVGDTVFIVDKNLSNNGRYGKVILINEHLKFPVYVKLKDETTASYKFSELKLIEKQKRVFTEEDPFGEEVWEEELNERRIEYKKELCQDIWDGTTLKEKIEKKLLKLAKDFFEDMELETEIIDIHLTGSMVSFNYNAESDIDVHIVIDFKDVNEDVELVKMAVDGQRFIWNMRHNVQIKGHDVELYIMDVDEEHISNGIYSLVDKDWHKKPKYSPPDVDTKEIKPKFDARVYDILKFEKISKTDLSESEAEEYYNSTSSLKEKIMKDRKKGLHDEGEFSIENLVFKKLRKTGKFKKLLDTIGRFYDKIYSQD
jgi:predicted nucleotidyltransferase